jgi:hypothetical protein
MSDAGEQKRANWSTGWLCNGCGHTLGLPVRLDGSDTPTQILEHAKDQGGEFFRCLRCGGKHYFERDDAGVPRFLSFTPGKPRLFRYLRRRLGLLGPVD